MAGVIAQLDLASNADLVPRVYMGLPGFAELYHPGKVRMSDIVTIFGRQT
jgi:hypothetical protein